MTEGLLIENMTENLMTKLRTLALVVACGVAMSVSPRQAESEGLEVATVEREGTVDFDTEILPFLKKNCMACHSASKPRGDVNLENPLSIRAGADGDEIVDPSNPEESLLFLVAAHRDDPVMPPKSNKVGASPLSPTELGLLRLWISQGAPDGAGGPGSSSTGVERKWQAFPKSIAPVYSVAISDDGRWVASGRANELWAHELGSGLSTRLVDPELVKTGLYAQPRVAHLDSVQSLAMHPDGEILASGGFRTVKIWRRTDATRIDAAQNGATRDATNDPESRVSLAIDADGKVGLRDTRDQERRLGEAELPARATTLLRLGSDRHIVVGCEDGSLHRFELFAESSPDQGPRWRFHKRGALPKHDGPITLLVEVSEAQILSASADGKIRWIDAAGAVVREVALELAAADVAVHPDGKHAVVAVADGAIKLVSLETGKPVRDFVAHGPAEKALARLEGVHKVFEGRVNEGKAALDAAEKKLKASEETVVKSKEALEATAKAVTEKEAAVAAAREKKAAHDARTRSAAAALTSASEAVANCDRELKELEGLGEGESVLLERSRLEAVKKNATARVAAATEGKKAVDGATAEINKAIENADKELSAASGKHVEAIRANDDALRDHKHSVSDVEKANATHKAATERVAASLSDIESRRKDIEPLRGLEILRLSQDGTRLASARTDGSVATWNVSDGRVLALVTEAHTGKVESIEFGGEAKDRLIVRSTDGAETQWELAPRWKLERGMGHPDDPSVFVDRVSSLGFSHDGTLLAIGSGEPSRTGTVEVRTLEGDVLWRLDDAHSDVVLNVEFSIDGDYLASCGADRVIRVIDVKKGKSITSFEGHTDHVLGVSWRFDGKILASCGADKVIKIWNFHERKQVRTIEGFGKQVTAIRFVADSPHAVACSGDAAVRLHDSNNGNKVRDFGGAKDYLYSLAVTPRGHLIAAGGFDSIVRVWNAADGKLIKELKGD